MKRFIYIIAILVCSLDLYAQSDNLDSLRQCYYSLKDNDLNKTRCAHSIANLHTEEDSTIAWSDTLIRLATSLDLPGYVVTAYSFKSWAYYYKNDYDSALLNSFKAIGLADSLHRDDLKIRPCLYVASCYADMMLYDMSDNFYLQTIKYSRITGDSAYLNVALTNLAINYQEQRLYSESENLLKEVLHIDSCMMEYDNIREDLIALSDLYIAQFYENIMNPDISFMAKAKEYSLMSHNLDSPYEYELFRSVRPLVNSMFMQAYFSGADSKRRKEVADSMQMFLNEAYEFCESMEVGEDILHYDLARAKMKILLGKQSAAKSIIDSVYAVINSDLSLYDDKLFDYYITAYFYNNSIGRSDSAYAQLSRFYSKKLLATSLDYASSSARKLEQEKFEEQTRQRLQREEKSRLVFMFCMIGLAILIAFGIWEYIRKRRHNKILNEKNVLLIQQKEEILSQKEEIQAQSDELLEKNELITRTNNQITDSINYASLIQKAVLPKDALMNELFHDYFVIYRPLNIVAGDFYWANRIGSWNVIVCADCTGHGVPGAFVSMLGVSLLNEICSSIILGGGNAADVLNVLRQKLMHSLGQSRENYENRESTNMDGMDLCMVMIDSGKNILNYAGAYRPLWLFRDGQLIEYKADKMPIGLYLGVEKDFTNHEVSIEPGDMLYMFSDGIPDQFGYVDVQNKISKHFSTKRLAALISQISSLDLNIQKQKIEQAVDDWKNGFSQLDDNIMIGIRL